MPAAPIPPPFENLGGRRFAFYPPIAGTASNEWTYRASTWSEVLVRNASSGESLSVPRRFVGEASHLDEPVAVVRLVLDLRLRDDAVLPARPRVIEMPVCASTLYPSNTTREHKGPAKVVGIRLEARTESRASKLVGGAVALGVLGCLAVVGYSFTDGRPQAAFTAPSGAYRVLSAADDVKSVVHVLGRPITEHRYTAAGNQIRVLDYRRFRTVLVKRADAGEHYIGTVDFAGRVLHSVTLSSGENSAPILRRGEL